MKVKDTSAKAGLNFNVKPKTMTTEEIHIFNMDNEDIKSVEGFAYLGSILHSNGDLSRKMNGRLRLERAVKEVRKEPQEQRCVM